MDFIAWKCADPNGAVPDASALGLPRFVCQLLAARGCRDVASAQDFLGYAGSLGDPFLLKDMDKAVARIEKAVAEGEKILIYGDYDCDGITSTVMFYDYLDGLGADVLYYIPERHREGYGLNLDAVERIKASGVGLVVTVDNGISSLAEAKRIRELGMDLVVTDHHHVGEALPEAAAVVNPHRPDCGYPFKDLCGAGVAFKTLCALEQHAQLSDDMQEEMLAQYGDLLAVGILADAVPLLGENRLLVKRGLETLADTQRPGLRALAKAASIDLAQPSGEGVTFGLAPRINVTGRMGTVDSAVELLLCETPEKAESLASQINALNQKRRSIDEQILAEATAMIAADPRLITSRVITLVGQGWHLGVIGITASRIVERYHKPCVIISVTDDTARGSARSVEGFSIIDAIDSCRDSLIKYGGHPMAAGLTLRSDRIDEFIAGLEAFAAERCPVMPEPMLPVDAEISLRDITLSNVESIERLAPFGCGNPPPVFALPACRIENVSPIGNGNHIKLNLSQNGANAYAVMFNVSADVFPFSPGDTADLAVALTTSVYNEQRRVSIKVVSARPCGFDAAEKRRGLTEYDAYRRGEDADLPTFGRDELSVVYRYLRGHSPYRRGRDSLYHTLRAKLGERPYFKTLLSLDILDELGLTRGGRDSIEIVPTQDKMDLADSRTYASLTKVVK